MWQTGEAKVKTDSTAVKPPVAVEVAQAAAQRLVEGIEVTGTLDRRSRRCQDADSGADPAG